MSTQAERLRQLELAHLDEVNRMKDFAVQMVEPAIDSLGDKQRRSDAIMMFLNGILDVPEAIHFRGKTFASYDHRFRHNVGDGLYRFGLRQFGDWLKSNWEGDMREWTAVRINERNVAHFMDTWYGGDDERPPVDWDALQRSHDALLTGHQEEIDPLYVQLFNGMQTSALELFLEDTSPGDDILNQFLLQ